MEVTLKIRIATTVVVIVLAIFVGFQTWELDCNLYYYSYEGTVSFASETEYSQFKSALVEYDVKWRPGSMTVLSSEPPILVSFQGISTSKEMLFPYGTAHEVHGFLTWIVGIATFIGLVILWGCYDPDSKHGGDMG